MSLELQDPEYEVEVTLVNGTIRFGPNTHPAELVRWVVRCFVEPTRMIPTDSSGPISARDLLERYLLVPERVGGVSHAELYAAVQARWG